MFQVQTLIINLSCTKGGRAFFMTQDLYKNRLPVMQVSGKFRLTKIWLLVTFSYATQESLKKKKDWK